MDFEKCAASFDNEYRMKRSEIIANKIHEVLKFNCKEEVMEFGGGTGLISFNLYKKLKKITVIDTSANMLKVLDEKIKKYNVINIDYLQADILKEKINFKFDIIYTSMTLHHIVDTNKVIKSLYNLLKDSGKLCIVDLTEDDGSFHSEENNFNGHNGFSGKDLESELIKCGFKNVTYEVFYENVKNINGKLIPYSLFIVTCEK